MELIARLEDGGEARIDLEREGESYRVAIGHRTYRVDVARCGPAGRSLLIGGAQHEVMVRAAGGGRYEVGSPRGLEVVEVVDPLTHLAREAHGGHAASGGGRVSACMPGRVVGLLVEKGAMVSAGQGVLVLEAMKMENEIAADHAGVVKRFFVEPGQAVESGDPLFEIG